MTIPIGTISNSQYSLRWRQPYVSESLNRKVGLVARGIHQGFKLAYGGANSQIQITTDPVTGISLAQLVGRSGANQFTLTLRLNNTTIDLAPFLAAGDIDQDFALVIRPEYVIGSPTVVSWELVRPADFTDALLDDVMVVGFLRTDAASIANPLQEVFVSGSAQSRGAVSQGWARQSLMIDYAKMGAPTGIDDGQFLELLYDSSDADFDRWREYLLNFGPQGVITTEDFSELGRRDLIDFYALRGASMLYPVAQSAGFGAVPDQDLFNNGYININEGPPDYPLGAIRVGGYDATWYGSGGGNITVGNPLVCSSPMTNWYPCKPGDKFIVQMWIKSGGGDPIYPPGAADPLIMQAAGQSGLGAFWGGQSRQFLDSLVQTSGAVGSEEVHALDPDMAATYIHSKTWTLYREEFICPLDVDLTPLDYQAPRWFAPFWKFVFGDAGHLLISGVKVWKERRGRETGGYDEYRLSHTADANPLGEAGRTPAQQPGRFSGGIVLNPQGTKILDSALAAQDAFDAMPWMITSNTPGTWDELIGHSPNVPAYSAIPPTKTTRSSFANPTPPSVGLPTHGLELYSVTNTLREWDSSTIIEDTADPPGIWEHLFRGGTVLRAEPDPVTNAMSDVRFALGDAADPLGTWSLYDYPESQRWCVREDGSMESNAHGIPQQGAQLQGSSDWGGKGRLFRTEIGGFIPGTPMPGALLGQDVFTSIYFGDDAALGVGNNAHKGWEAVRREAVSSITTPASVSLDAPYGEYHIDLADGTANLSEMARFSESSPFKMMRAINLQTLSSDNPVWTGLVGGGTVLEVVHDEASANCEVEDGQSVAFAAKMFGNGGAGGWPFAAGSIAFRRGYTTETTGPTGFRGDVVLSLYNSKVGIPLSHFAIDPFGCEHHYAGLGLDGLPAPTTPAELNQTRPGGDAIMCVNPSGLPAAAIYNWMPMQFSSGSPNIRIDSTGRLYSDPTTFTEYHYHSPNPAWVEPEVGDCMRLTTAGVPSPFVDITAAAQDTQVVGLYMGLKGPVKNTQNSISGEMAYDVWIDPTTGREIDWSTYVWDRDNPPELYQPDSAAWPELVQVAAVGDNRVFEIDGTPILAGFNVVDESGDIATGDLLETSTVSGKLRKQADDVIHSYTVGRALQAVSFTGGAPSPTYGVYGILMCG